jgi:putative ABC transport system permease protein
VSPISRTRMFWRILWRLMHSSRGPLGLALAVVFTGGAVCAALLNLDLDAGDKLTHEFRTLGANVVIAPQQDSSGQPAVMDDSVLARVAGLRAPEIVAATPYLYLAAQIKHLPRPVPVIVAGTWPDAIARTSPWWKVDGRWITGRDDMTDCMIGSEVARQLGLAPGSVLTLEYAGREQPLIVTGIVTSGSADDNQVFVTLGLAQQFANLPGRASLVQLSVQGFAPVVEGAVRRLGETLPDLDVRPVRQLAAAEGRLFDRIHGLLFVTVSLILVLTALGVLAAMAGLALERRRDVGLMKALGGTVRRVMRFFLAEATILGLIGGVLGRGAGMLLAAWIGRQVFAAPIAPRWPVLPATVALMVAVALVGALPLRLLGRVRPAEILRNE